MTLGGHSSSSLTIPRCKIGTGLGLEIQSWLWGSFCTSKSRQWWLHPDFETHRQSQPKSETESANSSTKWWLVTAKIKKKRLNSNCHHCIFRSRRIQTYFALIEINKCIKKLKQELQRRLFTWTVHVLLARRAIKQLGCVPIYHDQRVWIYCPCHIRHTLGSSDRELACVWPLTEMSVFMMLAF